VLRLSSKFCHQKLKNKCKNFGELLDSWLSEVAKPLYASTRGRNAPLEWTETEQLAFEKLTQALVSALALALPDIQKPFYLYVAEVRGIEKGVLAQTLGLWKTPIAYLSKRLDPVTAGWPICLRAITTMAILVKEVNKLTLGQELHLVAPQAVEPLLKALPDRWMTNAGIIQYQALLIDENRVKFLKIAALNPATLLLDSGPEEPIHFF
jgi:hypothetical protein